MMVAEKIQNFVEKVNNFLVSLKPFGAVMVVKHSGEVKIFDHYNGNYYSAALYISAIFFEWVGDNHYEFSEGCETIEELWNLCIEEKNFGSILGLYIQNKKYDFIRVYYD